MPQDDQALLRPQLEPVLLHQGEVLFEPYQLISHVYFFESGLSSEIALNKGPNRIEVGCIGLEGFSGVPVALGVDRTPHHSFMQQGGDCLKIETAVFQAALQQSSTLRNIVLRYVHVFMIQIAATALADGRYDVERRLARWILMCHDRLGDELPLTYDFLSLMLGVRRPSVTDALHKLEGSGAIKAERSLITVRGRAKLEHAVSSKGAEGIAQFMPATARQQGLADSFDVTAALDASARYLKRLGERFGNLGLAAAAYNAGEAAVARFLTSDRLPIETRDYVFAITGSTAEQWRDNPPETIAPALGGGTSFQASCVSLATRRSLAEPILTSGADWAPWGVQISAHYNPSIANKLFNSAIGKLPPQLKDQKALIVRQRGGNFGYRPRYAARIGRENRDEAVKLCSSIRAAGIPCTVFRNR
eukprot:g3890.t1